MQQSTPEDTMLVELIPPAPNVIYIDPAIVGKRVVTSVDDIMGVLLGSFHTPTHLLMVDGDVVALATPITTTVVHDWVSDVGTVVATDGSGSVYITSGGFTYEYQLYASMF